MNIKRLVTGALFFDNFDTTTLDEHWDVLPNDSLRYSLVERPGYLKMYHGEQDLYILTEEPENYVLDMRNEYVPLNVLVQSGLVVFRELGSNLEILEFYDENKPSSSIYEYIRLIKQGRTYTIYGRQTSSDDWELIDVTIFDSSGRVGLLCKGPQVSGASIFSVDYVKIYSRQEVKVLNVPQGYRVEIRLEENHAVIASRKVYSPYSGVDITLTDVPTIRAYFTILDENGLLKTTSSVFDMCGGDVYYYGTNLDVYVNGLDMRPDNEYFLGYYQDSSIDFTVSIHNPHAEDFNNIVLSAIQHANDTIGYTLVRFSTDDGVTWETTASIAKVSSGQMITFRGRILRDETIQVSDIIPFKFNLAITTS